MSVTPGIIASRGFPSRSKRFTSARRDDRRRLPRGGKSSMDDPLIRRRPVWSVALRHKVAREIFARCGELALQRERLCRGIRVALAKRHDPSRHRSLPGVAIVCGVQQQRERG